jgi:DNA-binding response OmpR family regulator
MQMARILIVDDDRPFRMTLHLALDICGYEVRDATNGEEGLEAASASAPDLVVLDWQLPGMDGVETCRELRSRSDIPVIMVSGNPANRKEIALSAGAMAYLTKPFSMEDLVRTIEAALETEYK